MTGRAISQGDTVPAEDAAALFRSAWSERLFLDHVLAAARDRNWLAYHTWRSDHSPSGFPDLVMVRLSRVIWAELKSEKGSVTDDQQVWLDALETSGQREVYVWRPSMWDEIVKKLT